MEFFGFSFDVSHTIHVAVRTLFGWLCGYIYDFIVILYDLFESVAIVNILESSDLVVEVYRKIGLILGLFMVFKLSFSLIQHLIDPSKFNDKKIGFAQIIKRSIIAIVLLGVTPTIFKEAFVIQNLLIGKEEVRVGEYEMIKSNNILYKLIVGVEPEVNNISFGKSLAMDVYFSFFTDNVDPILEITPSEEEKVNIFQYKNLNTIKQMMETGKVEDEDGIRDGDAKELKFADMLYYATLAVEDSQSEHYQEFYIEFNSIFCLIVGVIIAWMLISYIIQVGIRVAQLAYLQLIAPVPIFSYISDPDGAFSKWVKQCVATYLDLFIRLMVIYFVVALSELIFSLYNDVSGNMTELDTWTKLVILLGLLLFAKKVPDLLKDLFPSLGTSAAKMDLGLKSPKKAWNDYVASAPVVGKLANKVVGGTAKWAGGLAKKGAVGLGKFAAKPITVPFNNIKSSVKDWRAERANIKEDQAKAAKEARKNDAQYAYGQKYVQKYTDANGKVDAKLLSKEFSGEYKKSYDNVVKHKNNVGNAKSALDDAYAKLESAKLTGDVNVIAAAQRDVSSAQKNFDDAQSLLGKAKDAHALNMRKKEFAGYAKIENAFNYAKEQDDIHNLNLVNNSNSNVTNTNASPSSPVASSDGYSRQYDDSNIVDRINDITGVNRPSATDDGATTEGYSAIAGKYREDNEETATAEAAQKHFNELNGVDYDASDNGAPTEGYSAIAGKYREDNEETATAEAAQKHFNELNGVEGNAGNGPKVTAENSIFVQLDEEAKREQELRKQQEEEEKQRRMQEEFKNRSLDE